MLDPDVIAPHAVAHTLAAIRARAPLIHNITNLVVTNTTANALLAVGASPAMVEGIEEVAGFAAMSDALVLNLGTMSGPRAAAMRVAAAAARDVGTPWIMDPVAVGVLAFRAELARDLLAFQPAAIRGNASEIISLSGMGTGGKGVDAEAGLLDARDAASALARRAKTVVAVTGAVDHATDGGVTIACHNGHPMMTRVTGLGCTATAIIGACLAVEARALVAVAHGLALVGVAGELAAERARGPGSLQMEIIDALFQLDAAALSARVRLFWVR